MENINFKEANPDFKKENNMTSGEKEVIELSGPNKRIFDLTQKELSMLFGFGLRDINTEPELMFEINRHFFENEGKMNNKIAEWKNALSDVNRDATQVEDILAKNFAKQIFDFITLESTIKDRYNN